MKRESPPAGQVTAPALAAVALPGLWSEQGTLLLSLALLAGALLLAFWFKRRRRQDDSPADVASALEAAALEAGTTRVENAVAAGASAATPSPGLHGKIVVQVAGQQSGTYLVTDNPLPIGRDPAQSLIVIQEPIVSKLHCQIFVRGGQVFVRDMNSTNGVYVNDEKVDERQLQSGDTVSLGKKGQVRLLYQR